MTSYALIDKINKTVIKLCNWLRNVVIRFFPFIILYSLDFSL